MVELRQIQPCRIGDTGSEDESESNDEFTCRSASASPRQSTRSSKSSEVSPALYVRSVSPAASTGCILVGPSSDIAVRPRSVVVVGVEARMDESSRTFDDALLANVQTLQLPLRLPRTLRRFRVRATAAHRFEGILLLQVRRPECGTSRTGKAESETGEGNETEYESHRAEAVRSRSDELYNSRERAHAVYEPWCCLMNCRSCSFERPLSWK